MKIVNHFLINVRIALSPNVNIDQEIVPKYIIIHYDAASNGHSAVNWMLNPISQVSAHLHITRDGTITQLAPFTTRCWHSGKSYWKGLEDLNTHSIGIELQNSGQEQYTKIQLDTLKKVCQKLIDHYQIIDILGHNEISPGRKIDPGKHFPIQDFKRMILN